MNENASVGINLPKYRSHKVVSAVKIERIEIEDKNIPVFGNKELDEKIFMLHYLIDKLEVKYHNTINHLHTII